jgi:hypothetical protein
MEYKVGDLVVSYAMSEGDTQSLMSWGLVVETNPTLRDIRVLDNQGIVRWWSSRSWKIISKKSK